MAFFVTSQGLSASGERSPVTGDGLSASVKTVTWSERDEQINRDLQDDRSSNVKDHETDPRREKAIVATELLRGMGDRGIGPA